MHVVLSLAENCFNLDFFQGVPFFVAASCGSAVTMFTQIRLLTMGCRPLEIHTDALITTYRIIAVVR